MTALTAKQLEANALLGGIAEEIILFGGSRSGKTFLIVRALIMRALAADNSRHAIARFRFNAAAASIINDTFPKVMLLCFPGVKAHLNKKDWFYLLPNGSQIWVFGLDDGERVEKILGMEFATIFLNECSQIPKASRDLMITRLAQHVMCQATSRPLRRKMYYDENPPTKGHWTYKIFIQKRDPDTGIGLNNSENYAYLKINPGDNKDNLPPEYVKTLEGLSERLKRRFLYGEFADDNPYALFSDTHIDRWRHLSGDLPDFTRVVIGVDPSGSGDTDNQDNDEIGICVVGLGTDGNAYVLEDCTVKAGPATWGNVATTAFDRHQADIIVAEANFGGAMVKQVIDTARERTPVKMVTASRGKAVRAEPFSALYEQGKIRHAGYFTKLEDELCGMSTVGYIGEGSPNRADAAVWALTEIFPGLVNPRKVPQKIASKTPTAAGWMN